MATIIAAGSGRKASERKFYSRMALFLVALVLLGFAPSFYLRGIVPSYPRPNPSLPPAVLLHGGVFTLWMTAVVAQTQLIAARKHAVHMQLGKLTVLLAVLMLPVMYLTTVWQVVRATHPPMVDPLNWTFLPLITIPAFAFLIWQGWVHRRNPQWHKRAMLSAAILIVAGPSIGRLPIAPPTMVGLTILLLLGFLLFVPLVIWDKRSEGRIHPATWLGISVVAVVHLTSLIVFWTGADWASVARQLPGVA